VTSRACIAVGAVCAVTAVVVGWLCEGTLSSQFVYGALGCLLFHFMMAGLLYIFVERPESSERDAS